ncbi:MAG: KH domain-containing protein [Actinomycetota bacterium]|nr:KH domain-containing protein [Actinomycetota bacterium]
MTDPQGFDSRSEEPTSAEVAGTEESLRSAKGPEGEEESPPSLETVAETGRSFVSGLIEAMGIEGEVEAVIEEGNVVLNVSGGDMGAMIGRRGQTLEALQEVTRTAVQRRLRTRVRLSVDVEAYRARRRTSLEDYARSMAERAKERGTEIELEPMNAYERKIIHDAIAVVDGATSFSEGEEPSRKVIVRGDAPETSEPEPAEG